MRIRPKFVGFGFSIELYRSNSRPGIYFLSVGSSIGKVNAQFGRSRSFRSIAIDCILLSQSRSTMRSNFEILSIAIDDRSFRSIAIDRLPKISELFMPRVMASESRDCRLG